MAKPRSRTADLAVYVILKAVACSLLMMPTAWAVGLVRALAGLTFRFDRRHRAVALDNLRHAFPGRFSERQLSRLVRDVYEHFAVLLLEMLLIPRKLRAKSLPHFLAVPQGPEYLRAMRSGRPIVLVTAHYGNWEAAAYILHLCGFHGHLVGRPIDNPYIDAEVRRFRQRAGHKVLSKDGDVRAMRDVLKNNGLLVTLADQSAGARGLFVDFFGRPASTHKAIASLAVRNQAVIVVGGARNAGGLLDYQLWLPDVIWPDEYANLPDAVVALTQRITTAIERAIREDPRQYFWLHRRWKHQPPALELKPRQPHSAAA
jgi:Kdo2-lipid IVA lauroyltransferase/acyltransferase